MPLTARLLCRAALLGALVCQGNPAIGADDGILITIMLYGGNDGLNTVVPYGDGLYYQQRSNIAIAPCWSGVIRAISFSAPEATARSQLA